MLPEIQSSESSRPLALVWVGTSLDDLRDLPVAIRRSFGYALYAIQLHMQPTGDIKRYVGVADVFEIRKSLGDAYRLVYWMQHSTIYVLHVFKKKSHQGSSTPREDVRLVRKRLQQAHRIHELEDPR